MLKHEKRTTPTGNTERHKQQNDTPTHNTILYNTIFM